ncbi:hypothetical protein GCM10010869_71940 [Mesorhizobium tianshanense]|uniref:Uncharacterized protein n=1 Tax=Mesorhizobium tianshanense TaxID=39844 RepID=A0A562P477_9HYPH|nr:hypothetical protein [Mesorhizobium tianshanense]TWI39161.1 hypothetical protein IQ26_02010 [Mesorhizobium tianshanense]GLS41597.1 hypothetical protein GCM10010869_71940 [Mesorhizobium tianshanense]
MVTTAVFIAAVFVVGFMAGDRRAVRQCNSILDDHWRELMKSIREEPIRLVEPPVDQEAQQSTLH